MNKLKNFLKKKVYVHNENYPFSYKKKAYALFFLI